MLAAMAARHLAPILLALILLACAVLPAAGSNVRAASGAPDLDDLTFPEFKALLRWESYARAGCAVQGGCFDECLKGGLEVYDKPKGDSTGASIYLLSKLDNPPNSECRCPPAFGNMDAANTTFTGFYSGEPLILTVDGAGRNLTILVSWAGCAHVYSVEESFDRDGDGQPDFLGPKGAVIDTIPPLVGTILANAISATVAATIFANVATAVVEKVLHVATQKDLQSLAQGVDPEVVGVTGGALVPLLQQAGYLGIIGQIGGQGRVPAVVSRMSEGLAWVNFHLASLFANTTDSAPAVQKRRNLVASRRRHMRRMGFRLAGANITEANKCAKVEKSATDLRSTVSSVAIAIGAAFATRTRDHVQGILELPDDDLITQGRMTFMQFFGLTALTMPSIAGVASKQLAGSKELPTVMKSFMGLGEAALEAAVSGCPKYLGGGIVVLVVIALFFLGIVYVTRPYGPAQTSTEYTPTGPQPLETPFDQKVSRRVNTDLVLDLLPGQTWELVKPPRGEQVTGSSFGTGVPMQGMVGGELTYDAGRARQTDVEMITITIGGAAMGCCSPLHDPEEDRPIEEVVRDAQEQGKDVIPPEQTTLQNETDEMKKQIKAREKEIRALEKKKPATAEDRQLLAQKQKDLSELKENTLRNEVTLQSFEVKYPQYLQERIEELKKLIADGQGTIPNLTEKKNLELKLRNARLNRAEAQTMALLVQEIEVEKEAIDWDPNMPEEELSETLKLLRNDLHLMWNAQECPQWVKLLLYIVMLPSTFKQYVINNIVFYASAKLKDKDPSKENDDKFVGPISQFPNFGGHLPKENPSDQVCMSVQQGACSRVESASEYAGAALCRRLWGASVHFSRTRLPRESTIRSGTT